MDECINKYILNTFTPTQNQDYIYSNEFTYKDPKFNEDDPEMYTLNGLETSELLTPPILIHTWILANIFKPDDDILNKIFDDSDLNSVDKGSNNGNYYVYHNNDQFNYFTNNLFNRLKRYYYIRNNNKEINDIDHKINRLKNIFYKAINICYNNKTNFSVNIIAKTKIALENSYLKDYIISNISYHKILKIFFKNIVINKI